MNLMHKNDRLRSRNSYNTVLMTQAPCGASPFHGWRNHLPFAFGMTLLALSARRQHGFMVLIATPLVFIWIAYSVAGALRWPGRRRAVAAKSAILLLTLSTLATTHWWYAWDARANAQKLADAVLDFRTRRGHFPELAADLGVNETHAHEKWKLVYKYSLGKPQLVYASTFIPFDIYEFDFWLRTWIYRPS